ncbi:ABC transporter permease subunit [Salinicola rhizosphaerae]|uniref:Spermidine/putrescine ABC transporter ATP-binding protein n=1 Tax=Salinicola rhizosphaerae TaxID=1443141 RepID=A0ABQ3EJH5_9GAMM|nr:ABC transporter permease subunit [Salinicola rhizosphaerae]GHB34362.1 spermidine/putrescine ABC transporter ATP-binding protein [Salinicola rhizosphaerae]
MPRWNVFHLVLPGVIFLLLFLLLPTLQVLAMSVFKQGDFTAAAFAKMVSSPLYLRVFAKTFSIALQTTIYCLVLGYPLAYWVSTLNARKQRLAMFFILLPFWTSALIKNFSWLIILGRQGPVAELMAALGIPGGDRLLFNEVTVVFAMVHTMLPLAVVTMIPVLNQIDRRLLPAASTLGAGGGRRFWEVYFPLSMRGVAAAGLLTFVASLGFFITPELVGSPKETLVGQLIILQINKLQNWQLGCALAVVLLICALIVCFIYDRIFGISSMSGGGGRQRAHDSVLRRSGLSLLRGLGWVSERLALLGRGGRGRLWLSLYATLALFVLMLPIFGFVPMAFTGGTALTFPPQGFSLRWFEQFFASPLWTGAIVRSFVIGIVTAAITVVIGGLAALGMARGRSRFSGAVFLLLLMPLIVPPIVIAVSLFYQFAHLSLIATDLGIVIGHTVIALPIVFVILLSTFKGYQWQLDDVSRTLGAGRWQTLRHVMLPLVSGGLVAGFFTGFLQSFEELTVALFIGGGLKTTLQRQMWDSILLQATPTIAAASVIVLAIVLALFLLVELVQSRRSRARSQPVMAA